MKGKAILLTAITVLSASSFAQAQQAKEGKLSGTLDFTYLSKYIWRGFDYFADDHSAYKATVDLDLFDTGLGINVFWIKAISGGFENAETLGASLYYGNSLLEGETYVTDYKLGWVYWGYPDEPRGGTARGQAAHMQEFYATISWPKICPAGVVPSYTLSAMWPSEGKSMARNNAGWFHIFGLGYDLTVPGLLPDTPEQKVHLSAEAVYNDGVAPGVVLGAAARAVDHDWSHAVFGISTDFNIIKNLAFTPGFYYQSSWDDSVNTEDEWWLSLGLAYKF